MTSFFLGPWLMERGSINRQLKNGFIFYSGKPDPGDVLMPFLIIA